MRLNESHLRAAPATTDWGRALARALRGDGVASHFQPIVDLGRGEIAGHEALLRFPGHPVSSPARWLEVAHDHGCGAELEAVALRSALAAAPVRPRGTFLSVNIAPGVLTHRAVQDAFFDQPSLAGVVVELTEHSRVEHYGRLADELDRLRALGAVIAVDDTGAGYAGLQHLVSIRPEIIKLDRALVAGIDQDRPRRALVEMFDSFANRFDAWVLAEGVETPGELATLRRLGIPLAQGYLLARPAAAWQQLSAEATAVLGELGRQPSGPTLRLLLEPVAASDDRAAGRRRHLPVRGGAPGAPPRRRPPLRPAAVHRRHRHRPRPGADGAPRGAARGPGQRTRLTCDFSAATQVRVAQ